MGTIALDDTAFYGRTSTLVRTAQHAHHLDCQRCGSSLRGRYVGQVNGADVWRCGCGRRRLIKT